MKTRPINLLLLFVLFLTFQNCNIPKVTNNSYIVNVKDFGAKGDNIADDFYAINKAITYLIKSNKRVLYFPEGNYKMVNKSEEYLIQLRTVSGLTILGASKDKTKITAHLNNKSLCTAIFRVRDVRDLTFKNISFSAEHPLSVSDPPTSTSDRNRNNYNISNAVFGIGQNSNVTFDSTSFTYFYGPAIQFSGNSNQIIIKNSEFNDFMREVTGNGRGQPQPTGILINNKAKGIKINACVFKNIVDTNKGNQSHAIYLSNVQDVEVSECVMSMDDRFSFNENGSGGLQVFRGLNKNVSISNNEFQNVTSNLHDASDLEFKNNKLTNSRLKIATNDAVIRNNEFYLSTEGGYVGLLRTANHPKNISITGNRFEQTSKSKTHGYAIQLYGDASAITISENKIINFHTAILLGQAKQKKNISNCAINDNVIVTGENSRIGINIRSGNNNRIFKNSLEHRSANKVNFIRDIDALDKTEVNSIHSNTGKGQNVKNVLRKKHEK